MEYRRVVLTEFAKKQLGAYIGYVSAKLKSKQGAKNIMADFRKTVGQLRYIAGSLPILVNSELAKHEYRRINFGRHNFFLLYRIEAEKVIVDAVYHGLQDYENSCK